MIASSTYRASESEGAITDRAPDRAALPRLVPSLSGVKILNSVASLLPFARKAGRIGRHLP